MPPQRRWTLSVGISLSVLAVCVPCRAAGIELTAKAINSSLLTGEPLVLSVRIRADLPVTIPGDLTPGHLPFRILVDRGAGFEPYAEHALGEKDNLSGPGLTPVGVTREFVLGVDKLTGDWTFPAPGTYRLVAEYRASDGPSVRSNVVTVSVKPPAAPEREVYVALRRLGPALVVAHAPKLLDESLQPLVLQYPSSPYLQEPRLRDLQVRIGDVCSGYEPGYDVQEGGTPANPPPGPDMRPEVVRARARDLVPAALNLSSVPGPFQPDVLLTLARLYDVAGLPERASEVYERVASEFPDREAGRVALGVVGDRVPPSLKVQASPGSVWPPNDKLVSVTIDLEARDDRYGSPTIALVSVTCDDACDPSTDIVDAVPGADDRAFLVRAKRTGASAARTYTITYSAIDASGNKALASTTVVVPHDQGKMK